MMKNRRLLACVATVVVVSALTVWLARRGATSRDMEHLKAYCCLMQLGPKAEAAVPALVAIARDKRHPRQCDAIQLLGYIHSRPDVVLPVLHAELEQGQFRAATVIAIGNFGRDATESVPRLRELWMASATAEFQITCAAAIMKIDFADEDSVRFIVSQLDHTNRAARLRALEVLPDAGARGAAAVPRLRELLKDTDDLTRLQCGTALKAIDLTESPGMTGPQSPL